MKIYLALMLLYFSSSSVLLAIDKKESSKAYSVYKCSVGTFVNLYSFYQDNKQSYCLYQEYDMDEDSKSVDDKSMHSFSNDFCWRSIATLHLNSVPCCLAVEDKNNPAKFPLCQINSDENKQ